MSKARQIIDPLRTVIQLCELGAQGRGSRMPVGPWVVGRWEGGRVMGEDTTLSTRFYFQLTKYIFSFTIHVAPVIKELLFNGKIKL